MGDGGWDKGGNYGGGYLSQRSHPRGESTWVVLAAATVLAFSAETVVPCVAQANISQYTPKAKSLSFRYPLLTSGFSIEQSTPFDAALTVPSTQQLRAPFRVAAPSKRLIADQPSDAWTGNLPTFWSATVPEENLRPQAKHTRLAVDQPDTSWLTTALTAFDPATLPHSDDTRLRDRYKKVPQLDQPSQAWVYSAIPTFDPQTLIHSIDDRVWKRTRQTVYQFPLASTGFGTDGSSPSTFDPQYFPQSQSEPLRAIKRRPAIDQPVTDWIYQNLPVADVWSAAKFQNATSDRLAKRTGRDVRYDFTKQSFALLDARPVFPALDQLAQSFRMGDRDKTPIVTPDSYGWLYTNIPVPFDPQYLVHSEDTRLRERHNKIPQLDQPSQAWITQNLPAFDPAQVIHSDDQRMRARYATTPRLHDQPAQDWIYTSIPPFDARLVVPSAGQLAGSYRQAQRVILEPNYYEYVFALAWLHDVIPLTDTELTLAYHQRIAPIMKARLRRRR